MIASSGTALANLAYLIGAVVLAVIGGLAVWLRHRQPKSVDASMASFRKGLSALAPDRNQPPASRTQPAGVYNVSVDHRPQTDLDIDLRVADFDDDEQQAAAEAAGNRSGGDSG